MKASAKHAIQLNPDDGIELLIPVAKDVEDFVADLLELEAEVHQDLGGDALLLAHEAEEEMLGPDVAMVEVMSLFHGVFDDLLGAMRQRIGHRHHVGSGWDDHLNLQANIAKVDA